MKILVAVLFVIGIVVAKPLSDEIREALKAIHDECAADSGIEKEDIIKVLEEDSEDQKVKEHIYCFQEKVGVILDGKIQRDVLKEKLADFLDDVTKAEEIIATCAEEAEENEDPVDVAFALGKCIHREKSKE